VIRNFESNPRAVVAWWHELSRWINPDWMPSFPHLPSGWREARINELVHQIDQKEPVAPRREYDLAGVKWYGEGVFHRERVEGASLSASYLSPVVPGAFIYNRLFAWKASFAVVPDDFRHHFVSGEFPQFQVDTTQVLPHYLYLYFLAKRVLRAVITSSTGTAAVSRNRFKEEEFLNFRMPLPPIPVQQTIVGRYLTAREAVNSASRTLSAPIDALQEQLVEAYSREVKGRSDAIRSRFFVLNFKDLRSWDVKSGRAVAFHLSCPTFRPLGDFIEEATELIRPATEPDKEWPVYGVNNKEGVFLNSYQEGSTFNAPYKRIRKDWFFHNPTRCNVGSLGIVPEVPKDAITSPEYQVWRIKSDVPELLLPGYVACLIQTPFFLQLVQFNRVGAVKQRMYTENLMQVHIPYLPIPEQERYAGGRDKALATLEAAKQRLADARLEVEAMILGTKEVRLS
jgi:restriction endonuclease S subunit